VIFAILQPVLIAVVVRFKLAFFTIYTYVNTIVENSLAEKH